MTGCKPEVPNSAKADFVGSPAVHGCLLPISSPSPKQSLQTLLNPICTQKIELRSDSGGDISGRGY